MAIPLTAKFGIDHGQTLAILQPSIWKVRKGQKREKLLQYAERVWNITEGEEGERIDRAIAKTRQFFEDLGASTTLHSFGVTEERLIGHLFEPPDHRVTTYARRSTRSSLRKT